MSVKTFAELVPLYSHTPDGINYRKEEQHSLVYIDWETGAVDVVGGEHGRQPRREIASPDRPQLFLRKITTTIFAADVYTREPIVSHQSRCVDLRRPYLTSSTHPSVQPLLL